MRDVLIGNTEVKGVKRIAPSPLRCLPFSLLSKLPLGATDVAFT